MQACKQHVGDDLQLGNGDFLSGLFPVDEIDVVDSPSCCR
jgi:hypothetical protein